MAKCPHCHGTGYATMPYAYRENGWSVHTYANFYWLARYENGAQVETLVTPNGNTRKFRKHETARAAQQRLEKKRNA